MKKNYDLDELEEIAGFDAANFLVMDGYDDCVEGVVERFGQPPIICYNKNKVLKKLCEDMTPDEAVEWFEFNQIGAWHGDKTPCFLTFK